MPSKKKKKEEEEEEEEEEKRRRRRKEEEMQEITHVVYLSGLCTVKVMINTMKILNVNRSSC